MKGLEALERIAGCSTIESHRPKWQEDYKTIENTLKALEILKIFGFEIEDYTEDEHGSVSVKFKRIILDDEEIDLLKEVLNG